MLKRFLPVILTVSILICCIVIPASAAGYDPFDYMDSIKVDGDNDTVVCYFPFTGQFVLYDASWQPLYYSSEGNSFDYWFGEWQLVNILVNPWARVHNINPGSGYVYNGNYIDLSELPSDTVVSSYVKITTDIDCMELGSGSTFLYYFGSANSGGSVSLSEIRQVSSNPVDDGGRSLVFQDTWQNIGFTDSMWSQTNISNLKFTQACHATFTYGMSVTFKISSAYMDYIQTGRNEKLMKSIETKLAENGQTLQDVLDAQQQTNDKLDGVIDQQEQTNEKLDGIINDKVDGTPPEGSDKVDDYQQAENELLDSVQGGSNEFDDVSINAWDRIFTYSQSFMAFGLIFKLFADIPFIQSLLYVSLTLGAFAFMLNLASSLGSSLGRSTRQRQAAVRYRVAADRRRGRG